MFENLIGGAWRGGAEAGENINPSDISDVIGQFSRANTSDVDEAIAAAHSAIPRWSLSTISQRHALLQKVAQALNAQLDELGRELAREQGKTLAEGKGEVLRAAQVFDFYANECLRLEGIKIASLREGVDVEVTREPVGVVGIITPWNYPIAIPAWKIAPALCYGNTVVFKPADLVPHSAYALAKIIDAAGFPDGVFNLVMGRGSVVGQAMLKSPLVSAVTFTGSVATGRHVALSAISANPMKKVQLELGGKNPLVVLDDADLDIAIDVAVNGAYYGTGQRCTASSRLIVTEGIHDRFVAAMTERIAALKVGHALDSQTQIGPVVDKNQLDQNLSYIDIGQKEGATLAIGGNRLNGETEGFYMAPALFTGANNQMRIAREEIFGPVAAVIRVKDYEEALEVANDTEFGLSSGICTTSLKYASHFKRASTAGMAMVNLPTAGVDYHVPFGGRKNSSYGSREQGRAAVEFYTSTKTAYTKP